MHPLQNPEGPILALDKIFQEFMECDSVVNMFTVYRDYLVSEDELLEKIRNAAGKIVMKNMYLSSEFQKVHSCGGRDYEKCICDKLDNEMDNYIDLYHQLAEIVPKHQYYKYKDAWKFCTHDTVYLLAFKTFLLESRLITHEEVSNCLKIPMNNDVFHISIEEYLYGLLCLGNELSRLAINCVTAGDTDRPCVIFNFLSNLSKGFRLLNLKNDALRKKFDGLKYDVKKVEEVMYDLTIRDLKTIKRKKHHEADNEEC